MKPFLYSIVIFLLCLGTNQNVSAQAFNQNFDGSFPPSGTITVTTPIGTGASDPQEVPLGEVKWYRGDNSILGTNVPGSTPNAGLNPGRGGSGFAAVFDSWAISVGGKADLIFNNVNLNSFGTARLRFYNKNIDGTDVLRVFVRKTNTWQQVGTTYGQSADWSLQTILLTAFSGPGNDSVDIRFECTSDNLGSNYGLDDVSIDEAPAMTYDSTSVTQITDNIFQASKRQAILRVDINTSGASPVLSANVFTFTTAGSTNVADIKNASLFYTENSSVFDTTIRVGSIVASPSGTFSFTAATAIALSSASSKNYFWLCYDIQPTATLNNVVDAQFVSAVVASITRTPANGNPAGNRRITPPIVVVSVPANDGNTSSSARGPVANTLFHRSAALYTAAELNGLVSGSTISSIAYTITVAATSTVSGTIKLYAANTTDQSFSRSTTWTNLLSTPSAMKLVYTGPLTISNTTGLLTIPFDSSFVFTGGGLYIAFDWAITSALSANNPTYACNGTSTLISGQGQRNSQGAVAPSAVSNSSALRPILRIESPLQANDAEVQIVYSTGLLPIGQQQRVSASIKNSGASELANYTISLSVSGANSYTNQKVISLPSLSTAVVSFDAYTPVNAGLDTVLVSVASDDNNLNNSLVSLSTVNSTQMNYTSATTADGSAGFGTAAGIMAVKYQITDERYVRSIQAFISNSNSNVGNRIFGVIMDANGIIIGSTDTITIAALQINQYISLNLTNRVVLNNTSFYVGIGQISNTVSYMPIGTKAENPLRANTFFTSNINGSSLSSSSSIGRLMIGCSIEEVTPASVPNLGANREECAPYILSAGTTATSYLWSTGATTSSIIVNTPGIYTVRVDNGQGQISTDTVNLVVSTPFAPQISIVKTPDPFLCEGSTLTFKATTNAGNNKLFKWYVNGVLKQNSAVDSFVSTLIVHNDTVECLYYSGSLCATSDSTFSNEIVVKTLGSPAPATVDISSSVGFTICSGTSVTFTAITNNGGTAPTYQWFINGNAVTGATGPNFVRNGLGNGSKVSVRMTSNSNCIIGANVKLDTITMIVNSRPSTGFNATAVGTLGNYSFSNTTTSTLGVTYLWNFGNGATSTATNPTYKYNTPGIYTVKLVATNSCGKDSTSKVISVVIVGVEQDRNVSELSIFPNPSEGIISFNLDLVQEDEVQIDIVNLNGQLLHTYNLGTIKQHQSDLDLSWLSAGVYVIHIRGRLSSVQRRVVLR